MLAERTIPKRKKIAADAAASALDHESLFAAGVEAIERLARNRHTDYNVHDPGVTILELLCYVLTDLAYRASFPIQDLLASPAHNAATMRRRFATARRILPNRALTEPDYRKLMIDVVGVKNAWIAPATLVYHADTIRGRLARENPGGPGIVPVTLGGLHEVTIEYADDVITPAGRGEVIERVRRRLHANRNLCEDFVCIREIATQEFNLCCELELAPAADATNVYAQILFQVDEYLSPPVRQYSLSVMRERKHDDGRAYTTDEIFDGPALCHGFIPDDELAASDLRREIRLSDIISIIMDIEGVRAVRDIIVNPAGAAAPRSNKWVIPVEPGHKARLSPAGWRIASFKRAMPSTVDRAAVDALWASLARRNVKTRNVDDIPVPVGTYRNPAHYVSFQNHFPEIYGIGPVGLGATADPKRRALARQLKGYLLFFDQIMADYAAQLSRAADLFSLDPAIASTYAHQVVTSLVGYEDIYDFNSADPDDRRAAIAAVDVADDVHVERRNRFLDVLIARYGERFNDFANIMAGEFGTGAAAMIPYKLEFLRTYPKAGSGRALAFDYTLGAASAMWDSDNISGLERRIAGLIGMRNHRRRDLSEIALDAFATTAAASGGGFVWEVQSRSGAPLLVAVGSEGTQALAEGAMRDAIAFASARSGYQISTGGTDFTVVDEDGAVVARSAGTFADAAATRAAIDGLIEYLRTHYSDEGMYLIENILLRPEAPPGAMPGDPFLPSCADVARPAPADDDPFLPICPDPGCAECADEDPYTYRVHVVLPAYAVRFRDVEIRRWVERTIREEMPAHILPKICWVGRDTMRDLEKGYRDWLALKSGTATADWRPRLAGFIATLYDARSIYPAQSLRRCDDARSESKFVLGRTSLGTL